MSASISQVTTDRAQLAEQLVLDQTNNSQWINACAYRSCFCVASNSVAAIWTIEVLLPTGEAVAVALYDAGNLFNPVTPRYITTNAMCGLPIRFVADQAQPGSNLWVVFKS